MRHRKNQPSRTCCASHAHAVVEECASSKHSRRAATPAPSSRLEGLTAHDAGIAPTCSDHEAVRAPQRPSVSSAMSDWPDCHSDRHSSAPRVPKRRDILFQIHPANPAATQPPNLTHHTIPIAQAACLPSNRPRVPSCPTCRRRSTVRAACHTHRPASATLQRTGLGALHHSE